MSSIVAVAGGSGGLGRALVDALKAAKYEIVVLARKANPELEAKFGVRVLAADYASPDALVVLLEEHKIDTVISVMNSLDTTPELNLIQAADRSNTTHRFIPNIWSGIDYSEKHISFPISVVKINLQETLKKTGLEWTAIFLGIFLDYYAPGVPSYLTNFALSIDVQNNVAGIPGSGERQVHFTHSFDVAKFTVAALGLKKWERKYFVSGDKKSWKEVLAIVEQVKGVKFDVSYDSAEKMAAGEITELPIYEAAYKLFGGPAAKPMVLGMLAQIETFYIQGLWDFGDGKFLNDLFPEIKPLGMQEALEKSYPAK